MKTYRMTITSCEDRSCRRTVELSERHNLYDLHGVIVDEFKLDDDHLWAFYLSGKFFDAETEYGVSQSSQSPDVRLRELDLKRGKKIAYLLDFGTEQRHELLVDAIEEATQPLRTPRVVERVGTPPRALDDEDGDWGDGDTFDAEEDSPDFPEALLDSAAWLIELSDRLMAKATVSATELAEALKATREVLAACPDRKTLDALGAAVSGELDAELPIVLLELLKKSDGDRVEIEALQWTLARLPSGEGEPPEFSPELVAEARWVLNRFEPYGTSALEHFEHVPEEMIARLTRALLEACPNVELAEAFVDEAAVSPASLIAAGIAYMAPKLEQHELEELLRRAETSMGDPSARVDAAFVLIQADQKPRALAVIERVEDTALQLDERVELAGALELAGAPERAEQVLRDNLESPWMEPADRELVKEALLGLFARAGRTADAEKLEADERKRASARTAGKRGGVVRTGPKVGRNDPCPCGSGKKSKQCCNR